MASPEVEARKRQEAADFELERAIMRWLRVACTEGELEMLTIIAARKDARTGDMLVCELWDRVGEIMES